MHYCATRIVHSTLISAAYSVFRRATNFDLFEPCRPEEIVSEFGATGLLTFNVYCCSDHGSSKPKMTQGSSVGSKRTLCRVLGLRLTLCNDWSRPLRDHDRRFQARGLGGCSYFRPSSPLRFARVANPQHFPSFHGAPIKACPVVLRVVLL